MTQIQNTPALPGGLGAMPSAPAGRKDGGSADFSRLLNQSNQQLQQQSAQSARSTMAQLQSQQLATQQAQSQQQARQLEAQQLDARQQRRDPPLGHQPGAAYHERMQPRPVGRPPVFGIDVLVRAARVLGRAEARLGARAGDLRERWRGRRDREAVSGHREQGQSEEQAATTEHTLRS